MIEIIRLKVDLEIQNTSEQLFQGINCFIINHTGLLCKFKSYKMLERPKTILTAGICYEALYTLNSVLSSNQDISNKLERGNEGGLPGYTRLIDESRGTK